MMRRRIVYVTVGAVCVTAALAVSGLYDVSADSPHWNLTSRLLEVIRNRSIAVRAASIDVPDLADPEMVKVGAEHYAAMCAGCHLAPGMGETELRQGLYPVPPDLTQRARPSAESFQIIKHGIKMSAMPAWGTTHDDDSIWALVSFLDVLPEMGVTEYASLTSGTGEHDQAEHGHGAGPSEADTSDEMEDYVHEAGAPVHGSHAHSSEEAHH